MKFLLSVNGKLAKKQQKTAIAVCVMLVTYASYEAGSKIALTTCIQTPNTFENRYVIRYNLRMLRVFSASNRQKNNNIEPRPGKQNSYTERVYYIFTLLMSILFLHFFLASIHYCLV